MAATESELQANTTISGIVILRHYRLDELQLEAWCKACAKQEAQGRLLPHDWFDTLVETTEGRAPAYSYDGTVRAIVIENPHASVVFPADLMVGPFDQHWARRDGWFRLVWVGSELQRLQARGVPHIYL